MDKRLPRFEQRIHGYIMDELLAFSLVYRSLGTTHLSMEKGFGYVPFKDGIE